MWHLKRTLKNKTRKETEIKFCNLMAVPPLLCCSETWLLKQKDYSSLTAAEMVYVRSVKGYTRLDCFRSEDIRQELNVTPIIANIDSCRKR
jgi:hypothetical protein